MAMLAATHRGRITARLPAALRTCGVRSVHLKVRSCLSPATPHPTPLSGSAQASLADVPDSAVAGKRVLVRVDFNVPQCPISSKTSRQIPGYGVSGYRGFRAWADPYRRQCGRRTTMWLQRVFSGNAAAADADARSADSLSSQTAPAGGTRPHGRLKRWAALCWRDVGDPMASTRADPGNDDEPEVGRAST